MLGTYFVLILAMFIVMVVGAVLGYTGNNIRAHGSDKHSLEFRVKIKLVIHLLGNLFQCSLGLCIDCPYQDNKEI